MTEEEKKIMEIYETVKSESKIISGSLTRILMLAGPRSVQAILQSLVETNEKLIKDLKLDLKIEMDGGGK